MSETVKRIRVSMEDFIPAWENSTTAAEVSEKTGLQEASAIARACTYRKRGIPLKNFTRGGGQGVKLNVTAANELLAKLRTPANVEGKVEETAPASEEKVSG